MELKKGEKRMKLKSYLYAPLCSAVVLFAMSACSDDMIDDSNGNRQPGNGIVFGASASYAGDDVNTRTEYGDYSQDGRSQEIRWTAGDQVEIYSPESPNSKQTAYAVDYIGGAQGTGDRGSALLASLGGDGLQWNRTNPTQNFYAIYPSVQSIANTAVKNMVSFENGVLKGYVPINQQHTITKGGTTGWTATPNMDYLYMAAIKENQVPAIDEDGAVDLRFQPLTTTLEITIEGPTERPLASLNVFSDNVPVVGHFTCDLTAEAGTGGYPQCVSTQEGTTNTYATVSLYYDDNGTQRPLSLGENESITLNVFLLPVEPLTNVKIRIAGFNSASKSMTLDTDPKTGSKITLNPHKKTRVTIPAPMIGAETNNWITGIEDNVYVSQLSIPGTANSFSYNYPKNGANRTWYVAQTADFEEQWNAGIRCFELKCPETTGDLGDVVLQCNRTNLGSMTFKQAVDMIWAKVQNSGEFAMIIPAYESGSGHESGSNAAHTAVRNFANALNTFYDNNSQYKYVTYGRNITVGEARGGLMFVARITSEEDEGAISSIRPHQGVFIEGWGSLKDLWARRGYGKANWAKDSDFGDKYMEYYMINGNDGSDLSSFSYTGPTKPTGAKNFRHTTIRSDGSTGTAYIHDWNRVSPESKNYELWSYLGRHQNCYWPKSFDEKCGDVWSTFMAAIEDNNNQQGSTFYINSLDGFYIDENIPLSYKPYISGKEDSYWGYKYGYGDGGTAGNIQAYAADINSYFYNEILSYGADNIYGPMNVVLLDMVYASDDMTDPGSYLPSVIINNNYRFPLMTKETGEASSNSADASFSNGGSVWE